MPTVYDNPDKAASAVASKYSPCGPCGLKPKKKPNEERQGRD